MKQTLPVLILQQIYFSFALGIENTIFLEFKKRQQSI